jgi:hypothetical protein
MQIKRNILVIGACQVAVEAVMEWLSAHKLPHQVIFCCYEDDDAVL